MSLSDAKWVSCYYFQIDHSNRLVLFGHFFNRSSRDLIVVILMKNSMFRFAPSPDDAFIVALTKDDNENDVALDIISRNPLYTDLSDRDELIMNVRQIANYAFLHGEYEEALNLYNIAIDITKSLPILFNSRALCYIR